MNELITTSPIEIEVSKHCSSCRHRMNPEDNFCRNCGVDCRGLIVPPGSPIHLDRYGNHRSTEIATVDSPLDFQKVVDNRMVVVGLIAFLGPVGLMALWFSRRFTKPTKIIVTTSYVLLAFVLPIAITWYWLNVSVRPIVDMLGK